MSTTITVPKGFSWVVASLASVPVLLVFQTVKVVGTRIRAKIEYPRMYADKAEQEANPDAMVFNCTQRAHQNTLEAMPCLLITTLIAGLRYPHAAAGACGIFVLTRFFYTQTYSTGQPKTRATPARLGYFILLSLMGTSVKVAYDLVMADI